MTLKYKWHASRDVYELEVEVPDDTVFIHVDGDIGQGLHQGFGHYLGCSVQEVGDCGRCDGLRRYMEFPGITLFSFNNVVFETDISIIPAAEFYSRFDIGSYYIFRYTRSRAEYVVIDEGDELPYVPTEIIPARLVAVSKIVGIRSQYLVDAMICTVSSWLDCDNRDAKAISFNKDLNLFNILDDNYCDVVVRKDCDREFTEAINQVLGVVGKKTTN